MDVVDPITGRHYPNRILFLIDLTPLALLCRGGHGLRSYLDRVLSAAKPFLSSPQFSSALFAFKPFFSSLSPLLSSSKLPPHYSSLYLSFLHPRQTLTSLARALLDLQDRDFASVSASPRGSLIAAGLRQILHEYDWSAFLEDDAKGNSLVVLFSPVGRSREQVLELLESDGYDDGVDLGLGKDDFCGRTFEVFTSVCDVFVSKRIHLCWIDVECEAEGGVGAMPGTTEFAAFKEGIKRLEWGFCSSESIILGSAILPFGLIYPNLGTSPCRFRVNNCGKRVHGSLNLEIMDVSNKPLDCKCCDIELMGFKIRDINQTGVSLSQEFVNWPDANMERKDNTNLDGLSNGEVKICFMKVQKHEKFAKWKDQFMEPILVKEYVAERGIENKGGNRHDYFADMVLGVLAMDMGEFGRKSPPLWQIILSFMYREGYWALVSLQDQDGKSKLGILKPFTYSSALIFLRNDDMDDLSTDEVFNVLDSKNGHYDPSYGMKNCMQRESRKRRSKVHLLQNLSWDDVRKESMEGFEINLEEEFFASKHNQSKKLKFIKCWMKQVAKTANTLPAIIKHSHLECGDNKVEDSGESPQETEHPVSASTSAAEDSLTAASKVQDEFAVENDVESCDDFLGSISAKIRQGIELEGADLGALAERLVHSTIYWISQKYDSQLASESQYLSVTTEVMDILLCEPKELAEKCRKDTTNSEHDASFAVREFELQILFRMEILRSQVAGSLKDTKQRFVKQICVLLESIQCQLEGGFFGDWSLDDYVEKIIKRRYFEVLEDVVNQIYSRMDLLLFNDEDEAPLDSEDSYKSSRDGVGGDDVARYLGCSGSNSTEEKSHQDEDYLRRLSGARERRERARRFKSFTSSIPDLLRVWAPKVLTSAKNKTDSRRKKHRTRATCDMVLETPSTENKRFCHRLCSPKDHHVSTSQPGTSVSKTLFPEDP